MGNGMSRIKVELAATAFAVAVCIVCFFIYHSPQARFLELLLIGVGVGTGVRDFRKVKSR